MPPPDDQTPPISEPPDEPGDGAGEPQHPRRAASAQFTVSAQVGSAAAMREAMDPANQSLADALRLSYRVLKVVIVVLIGLFLLSGLQTVEPTQSGVMIRFGRILPAGESGAEALDPGLHVSLLPYPAGEFILFDVQNQSVDLTTEFWPRPPEHNQTEEQVIELASTGLGLTPGRDNSLILRGGDLGHMKLSAKYEIDKPELYVKNVDIAEGRDLVSYALERATVHVAAGLTLQELTDKTAQTRDSIRVLAQKVLDDVGAGIRLTEITINDAKAPFAIVRAQRELQSIKVDIQKWLEETRQQVNKQMLAVAGPKHGLLIDLIDQYELAVSSGDEEASAAALARVNAMIEGPDMQAEVVETIERARSYQSEIDSTLGSEARLFASLVESYRKNPQLIVTKRWLEAYKSVLARRDVEVYYVPDDIDQFDLTFPGNGQIARLRQEMKLNRQQMQSFGGMEGWSYIPRAPEIAIDKAGQRLDVTKEGEIITPRGAP